MSCGHNNTTIFYEKTPLFYIGNRQRTLYNINEVSYFIHFHQKGGLSWNIDFWAVSMLS